MQTCPIGQWRRQVSSDAHYEIWETATKTAPCTHPHQVITLTATHPGTEHWKPFRGVLCACSVFSKMRLICSYFSQVQQRKRVKERQENELSALLKRFMISHTHSQARSLPDTTPLISRPENWRASHSWATAQCLAGPQGPTKPCALPHPANRKASLGKPGYNWLPGC